MKRPKKPSPAQQEQADREALEWVVEQKLIRVRDYMRPYLEAVIKAGNRPLREEQVAMNNTYILDEEGNPKPAELLEWAKWFERSMLERRIAFDEIGDFLVSTVFLGLDHGLDGSTPLLFETIMFLDGKEVAMDRYATRAEALAGHARWVANASEKGGSDKLN